MLNVYKFYVYGDPEVSYFPVLLNLMQDDEQPFTDADGMRQQWLAEVSGMA